MQMHPSNEIRLNFNLKDRNTAITREDFEKAFYPTKEMVTFTFQGWDGKSYDGESRTARVWHTNLPGFEDILLVKVGKHIHMINEESSVLEKATGEYHKTVWWVVSVLRAGR